MIEGLCLQVRGKYASGMEEGRLYYPHTCSLPSGKGKKNSYNSPGTCSLTFVTAIKYVTSEISFNWRKDY
jgi:hypothetical protein